MSPQAVDADDAGDVAVGSCRGATYFFDGLDSPWEKRQNKMKSILKSDIIQKEPTNTVQLY